MTDLADDFRAMRATTKERHERWHQQNRAAIDAAGIPYTDRGEALLFRLPGVCADFYPSTGRWRVPGERRTYRGGAQAFLAWLSARREARP